MLFQFQTAARLWACGLVVLIAATSARSATIGNVASFNVNDAAFTFSIDDGSTVRLDVLTSDMVRVRVAPDGIIRNNVSRAAVQQSWPMPAVSTTDTGAAITITTDDMTLVVNKVPFFLTCRDANNNLIVSDDPTQRIQWDTDQTKVFKQTQSDETYLGLGWRTHGLIRNGTLFNMNNKPTYNDPTVFYSGIPLWYGHRNGLFYGIFFDDTSWGQIDVGQSSTSYMSFENIGGQVDYYYFAGPTMPVILDRFTQLTGRPFMPPRWSIGYQQCRWSYTSDAQILSIASELRTRNIPCDVIYLDIDYMPGAKQLTFDSSTFPDPAGMIATLHNQGFKVVANISPYLFHHDPKFAIARDNNFLMKRADGSIQSGWHDYWYFVAGADVGNMSWIDFSKTAACNWWADQHTPFINFGIDGIWNDLNEPDQLGGAWPADLKYDFDGQQVDHSKTSIQFALLQTELSYDILADHYPNRRPFVLSRGGYAGIQRVSALWSGDNKGGWTNHMKVNIPMGLSMSISGNPFNGHDIGGFFSEPNRWDLPNDELYIRWMQSGVFSPFCRQHHDGNGNYYNSGNLHAFVEPWRFNQQVENICRDFIGLRYRLMPYLYTLFHAAHERGEPIQRPTLYDFPNDAATFAQDYDFMFGPYMLVSPITQPSVTTWPTYLPAGTEWIDYWDDSIHDGGQTIANNVSIDRIPIYVRSGAIIPTVAVYQHNDEQAWDEITCELYPNADSTSSSFTLYEDDGISWDYQSGQYLKTPMTMNGHGDSFTFQIDQREGTYQPATRSYVLKVHRWPGHATGPKLNDTSLVEYFDADEFNTATQGLYLDDGSDVLWVKFADTGGPMTLTFGGRVIYDVQPDMDRDGDVDQVDFGLFQACYTSPGAYQGNPDCQRARLDADTDVDNTDFAIFEACYSGPDISVDPNCMD